MELDAVYMRRALQLSKGGEGRVAPNPMVGAVVVARGRIIGEGYHRTYGGPHAEVNAISSVKESDRRLLKESTIYVTLEPCSHYGKTPPCAKLIIDSGIPRVVVGAPDPNPLVAGRGTAMLRHEGIEVIEGVMLAECMELNRRFMTAQTHDRPWIQLKWAQSADGFIAAFDDKANPVPAKLSNDLSSVWMHRERASAQAILVGSNTLATDHPRLDVRFWAGKNPLRVDPALAHDLPGMLSQLKREGIHSLMVEGGAKMLNSFIDANLFDEIRVETSKGLLGGGVGAPVLPEGLELCSEESVRGNRIATYRR